MNLPLFRPLPTSTLLSLTFFSAGSLVQCELSTSDARVLIYSATRDFRHDSIPTAVAALQSAGPSYGVEFDHTEDETWFSEDRLQAYDALVFLSNTGEVLDESEKAAFQNYLNLGGNFIGIHSASDCLRNTTFFLAELGAAFDYHPILQNATIDVIGPSHPSTSILPAEWHVEDEMYNFKSDPRTVGAVVVLSANESSYIDTGTRNFDQGTPHPTAWYQEHAAGVEGNGNPGRSFYTSLGHLNETWQDDLFMAHVMGGVSWALQANTTKAFNSTALVGNAVTSSSSSSSGAAITTTTIPSTTSSSSTSTPSTSGSGFDRSMSTIQLLVSISVCVAAFSML